MVAFGVSFNLAKGEIGVATPLLKSVLEQNFSMICVPTAFMPGVPFSSPQESAKAFNTVILKFNR